MLVPVESYSSELLLIRFVRVRARQTAQVNADSGRHRPQEPGPGSTATRAAGAEQRGCALSAHQKSGARACGNEARLRPDFVRRRVDQDVIEVIRHLLEKHAEARSLKQLHRIGHGRSSPEEMQSFQPVHRHDCVRPGPHPRAGRSNPLPSSLPENAVGARVSQVGVNQKCAAGKLTETHRQIGHHVRLAVAFLRADDREGAPARPNTVARSPPRSDRNSSARSEKGSLAATSSSSRACCAPYSRR